MSALEHPGSWRQSSIARFDACPHSLLLQMIATDRHAGPLAAAGAMFHRVVARLLSEMRTTGEHTYPVELGLVALNESLAQVGVAPSEFVHVPAKQIERLRQLVTRWCENVSLDPTRIIAVEERLHGVLDVALPNGEVYQQVFTGQPDAIIADPPSTIIIPDWKSGWMPPSKPRAYERNVELNDRLSDHGFVQQVIYGLLGLQNFPVVERVTLREYYVLYGEYREASIHRGQVERLRDILAGVIAQMDAAVAEGTDSERWVPTAGTHCAICPSPRQCPIREWAGIPTTEEEAKLVAREWIVAGQVRTERMKMAKGWVEAFGPIEIENAKGRRQVGWIENKTGDGRRFTLYEPEDAPESPFEERLTEGEVHGTEVTPETDFGDDPPF
jgi:PD-(D/E)XK nuclease superfamily